MREKIIKNLIVIYLLIVNITIFGNGKNKIFTKEEKSKIVYLTFDDGPSKNTDLILEILKKNNIKATFFVIGKNQDKYKKIVDEGHTIALHTYTHNYKQIYASETAYFSDLYKIRDTVKEKTGVDSKIIRFPGGSSNSKASKYLKERLIRRLTKEGFIYQDWNCDSTDASGNGVPASKLLASVMSCKSNQINLLMHDSLPKKTTVEALQSIIDYYKNAGYKFERLTMNSFKTQHLKLYK